MYTRRLAGLALITVCVIGVGRAHATGDEDLVQRLRFAEIVRAMANPTNPAGHQLFPDRKDQIERASTVFERLKSFRVEDLFSELPFQQIMEQLGLEAAAAAKLPFARAGEVKFYTRGSSGTGGVQGGGFQFDIHSLPRGTGAHLATLLRATKGVLVNEGNELLYAVERLYRVAQFEEGPALVGLAAALITPDRNVSLVTPAASATKISRKPWYPTVFFFSASGRVSKAERPPRGKKVWLQDPDCNDLHRPSSWAGDGKELPGRRAPRQRRRQTGSRSRS